MSSSTKAAERPQVIDVDEEGWDALDEIHGIVGKSSGQNASRSRKVDKPFWVPHGMDPVLEELPKWTLLADILKEIEGEIIRQESLPPPTVPSTGLQLLSLNERAPLIECRRFSCPGNEYRPCDDVVDSGGWHPERFLERHGRGRSSRNPRPQDDDSKTVLIPGVERQTELPRKEQWEGRWKCVCCHYL